VTDSTVVKDVTFYDKDQSFQVFSYDFKNIALNHRPCSVKTLHYLIVKIKKLSYRRVTARCVLSVVILPITTQQYRN